MMALLFHREIANLTKKALTAGLFLGFLFFVTMAFEMLALKQAGSSLAVQQGNLTGGFTYGLLSAMTYALAIIASLLFPYLFRSTSP